MFGANDWNDKTLQYLKSVNSLDSNEVREIMELSHGLVKSRDNPGAEVDQDDKDSQGCLIETTFSSSEIESDHSGDEMPGWGYPEGKGKDLRSGFRCVSGIIILIIWLLWQCWLLLKEFLEMKK